MYTVITTIITPERGVWFLPLFSLVCGYFIASPLIKDFRKKKKGKNS